MFLKSPRANNLEKPEMKKYFRITRKNIVIEKSNGASRCLRPASKKHLKELLEREELGLGELWYSGALGSN